MNEKETSVNEHLTIDITPTWLEVLEPLLTLLIKGKPESRKAAVAELKKMASLADRYVHGLKGQRTAMRKLRALRKAKEND